MICVISLHFKKHKHYLKWIIYTTFNLPNTWEQSAKQKGAVALDEGGEEGEDAIDGERDEERLSTAYPVSQSAPEESTDHHPKIYDETCGEMKLLQQQRYLFPVLAVGLRPFECRAYSADSRTQEDRPTTASLTVNKSHKHQNQ